MPRGDSAQLAKHGHRRVLHGRCPTPGVFAYEFCVRVGCCRHGLFAYGSVSSPASADGHMCKWWPSMLVCSANT
eukprot:2185682-Alexandrium_andersonii.AAC.1